MKKKYVITCAVGFLLVILCAFMASGKITYLENPDFSNAKENIIEVNSVGTELEETFTMPFELVKTFTVLVSNYGKDNNSRWEFVLQDASGNTVAKKRFNFTDAGDGQFYKINLDRTVRVKKDEVYTIKLKALKINDVNKMAFFTDSKGSKYAEGALLSVDRVSREGTLCMTVQGGNIDYFWGGIATILGCLLLFCVLRGMYLTDSGKDWRQDTLLRAALVGTIVFLLYLPYADPKVGLTVTDENDNICGGMLLAGGKVLYRDYVTQHTPVGYYLCAIFALLGASSVEQMRILFYLVIGIVWAGMYARYHKTIGAKVMMWLPVMVTLCSKALIGITASMVMSDVIQEISMILLLSEFLVYRNDQKLGWDRSIVISFGVWAAFGSAFISAYSICILGVGFLVFEIIRWKKEKIDIKIFLKRYTPLVVCGILPPLLGMGYFAVNHALYEFYRQAYLFNREVYPNYQSMGKNLISPFLSGVSSMFEEFANGLLAVGTSNLSGYSVLFVILVGGYLTIVIKNIIKDKKFVFYWVFMTLLIGAGATRGVGNTHGLAFWGMLIAVIIIYTAEEWDISRKNWQVVVSVVLCGLLLQPYLSAVISNITTEQMVVNSEDRYIVEATEAGEEIFIDEFSYNAVYLIAKHRYPVNRATYILPWYMDWYEEWELEDLKEKEPDILVWNPDIEIWGWSYFCNELRDYAYQNYMRLSDTSLIWRKK